MLESSDESSALPTIRTLDRPIYYRLFGETDKAFEAFHIYRDMGAGRSIEKVARQLSKSHGLLDRWAKKYSWTERVRAYEDHLDQLAREEVEKARREMIERHIRLSGMLQSVGTVKLVEWQKQIQAWQQDPDHNKLPDLTPSDIVRLIELGIRIERLSRGEPSYAVDVREITYTFIPPRPLKND